MTRRRKAWFASFGVLLLTIAAGVYVFEWNMLRGPIAKRVELATGRTFAINGNLDVRPFSRTPRITAEGIVLGNAPWAKQPSMADVGKVDFTIDALALWRGRVVLPEVAVSEARLSLEKNTDGAVNWDFGKEDEDKEAPHIGALVLDRANVKYVDPGLKTDFETDVSTIAAGEKDAGMMKVTGRGRVKGLQGSIDGIVGSVLALSSAGEPYPIRMRVVMGPTRARVSGTLLDPLRLKGEDLSFELEGADLAHLFPLIGVPLPPTAPYKLSGHLNHKGNVWTFRKFAGRVGASDLAGDFAVDRGQKPQLITADLVSRNLDMKDLGGFVGADRGTAKASPKPPPPGRVLPQEPFSLEKLRTANANVKFRGERVLTEKLPVEKITTTLKLHNGVLVLEPLNFGVAGGNLVSTIRMDARHKVIRTKADIAVRQLRLEKLFPEFRLSHANSGVISGRIRMDTTGNSIAAMMADADGDAAVMMEGGSVSELLVRLVNLDVANAIPILLTGDKQLPVRCMVTHLKGVDGEFKVQTLVLDTGKAILTGTGGVSFVDESLDLKLVSRSKGFSLVALRGPINIKGTFKDPKVGPDVPRAAARGVAAIALGWLTGGPGALIPLVDLGGAKDSDCAALLQEAGTVAAPAAKPRPLQSAPR